MPSHKSYAIWISGMISCAAAIARGQSTFTNPISPSGADPWVQLYNGTYYYTYTTGNNVSVAAASTIAGIGTAPLTTLYTPPAGDGNVWAPELHYINGSWYAYYSMTTSSTDHRMYVLQSNSTNPQGSYTYKGEINDPTNNWAIDGTVLTTSNGNLYFIWSGWAGTTNVAQNLYIAPMSNPWTISGNRVLISSPNNSWEQQGGPPTINEGPEVLTSPGGTTTLIYSASGSWTNNYCLGQLTLTGSDPLNPASWTKDNAGPVFASANGVYGPGHASFTTSDNGTRNWIVYHAAVSSGSGWTRNIRSQPFSWNPDGTPSFGQPVPVTVPIQWGPTSWVGAINESNNDTVHSYNNTANWVNGTINDSFANVTLTDNTTLFFNADRTTTGDMIFTYGSGQKTLSLTSDSSTNRTLNLSGNIHVNILGGTNSIYFGSATNPLTVAMGSSQRNFNIASGNTVFIDSNLTGTAGLNVSGGGILTLRGAKNYSGPTLISNGELIAGDGNAPSSTTNLPAATVVTINSAGTLQLNGLTGSTNIETIAGLTGSGIVNAPGNADTLKINNATPCTFSGNLTGSNLALTEAGSSSETLSGTSTYGGVTTVTGGSLIITGTETGTSSLFVKQGSASIATGASLTTTSYVSIGQAVGDNGVLNVSGALTVPNDLNIGDVSSTGVINILPGATVATRTLYVGKFQTANGTVNQSGGAITALSSGGDWRIGGDTSSDTAAIGLYNLSGGSINSGVYNFQIGAYGTGTLIQSAGSVTTGGYLSIGRFPGGNGNYNISGGSLTATAQPLMIVGEQGTGTLRVSGSAIINSNTLSIGLNGGAGTVILSGGTLNSQAISRGSGTATLDLNGGTVTATAANSTFIQGLTIANVQSGGAIFNTAGFNITVNQPLVHDSSIAGVDGGLTKQGAGTLTIGGLETYTGNTTVTGGTLAFAPNTLSAVLVRPVGSINIATGSTLIAGALTPGTAAKTLLVAQNPLAISGTLDLGINDMDVKNGDIISIVKMIQNGNEIISSTAASNPLHLTTLAAMQNITGSGAIVSNFDTQSVSATDVLVRYTYFGDANMDGRVDGTDYSRIDNGLNTHSTGWNNGDFNLDGVINGSDYTLIDNAFDSQGARIASLLSDPQAIVTSQIAAVPEPGFIGATALAVVGLLGRRRRRL